MKKSIRSLSLASLVLTGVFLFSACSEQQQEESKEAADKAVATADAAVKKSEETFAESEK